MERRLAAILAADVAGYTALMGADEAGTLQRLTGLRRDFLEPLIDELLSECGSDPAFYEFMRGTARQVGARVPERVNPRA